MADGAGPVGWCALCEAPYYFDNTKRCWNCGYGANGAEGPPADLGYLMLTPEFDAAVRRDGAIDLDQIRRLVRLREPAPLGFTDEDDR